MVGDQNDALPFDDGLELDQALLRSQRFAFRRGVVTFSGFKRSTPVGYHSFDVDLSVFPIGAPGIRRGNVVEARVKFHY